MRSIGAASSSRMLCPVSAMNASSKVRPPVWSRDGRLLYASLTLGERLEAPRDPRFVASLRRQKAAAARRRARGAEPRREVDYDGSIAGKGFEFRNPQVSAGCGCGRSFQVNEDALEALGAEG